MKIETVKIEDVTTAFWDEVAFYYPNLTEDDSKWVDKFEEYLSANDIRMVTITED